MIQFESQSKALKILRKALDIDDADFRPDQWPAISGVLSSEKQLVVQRTGWGKSSVYFISTRMMRDEGFGPSIIISPLLGLMRNQIESARSYGVNAATINSSNKNDWEAVEAQLKDNKIDCLLISPERLANETFASETLLQFAGNVSFLVVDEAHCISDWGHDFRPDYRRIVELISRLPPNIPVLCTTATANDRVIDDIVEQVDNIQVLRGPLTRDSLVLDAFRLPSQAERLAWLVQSISTIEGSGIVYVLTRHDAAKVNEFLQQNGIASEAYFGGMGQGDEDARIRTNLERRLIDNDLKCLVSTSALGMGFDKPDLHFVFHFQCPSTVIDYYQQVGRAGRGLSKAYGVLMNGAEDEDIVQHFRNTAFPAPELVSRLLKLLSENDGLSTPQIQRVLNIRQQRLGDMLKFLAVENPSPIFKDGRKWTRTPVPYEMDMEKVQRITEIREREWATMQAYIDHSECRMVYLANALDDTDVGDCGKCENCLGESVFTSDLDTELVNKAAKFLRLAYIDIEPRKKWATGKKPSFSRTSRIEDKHQMETGLCLSKFGHAGWGRLVKRGKAEGKFNDELVEASATAILKHWHPEIEWVCSVPSLRNKSLVPDYAERLAAAMRLEYYNAVKKEKNNRPQKTRQNSYHQLANVIDAFLIAEDIPKGPVLLVDDIVDSRWTMTMIAAMLREKGVQAVYPFALASTAHAS